MKRVDTIARVRRAFYVQRWSVKKIVRELHVSRNTVRKILRTDETDFSYERERHRHHQPGVRRMADRLRRRQDDHGAARPPDPSLRNPRNRQRVLALQKPRLTPIRA